MDIRFFPGMKNMEGVTLNFGISCRITYQPSPSQPFQPQCPHRTAAFHSVLRTTDANHGARQNLGPSYPTGEWSLFWSLLLWQKEKWSPRAWRQVSFPSARHTASVPAGPLLWFLIWTFILCWMPVSWITYLLLRITCTRTCVSRKVSPTKTVWKWNSVLLKATK